MICLESASETATLKANQNVISLVNMWEFSDDSQPPMRLGNPLYLRSAVLANRKRQYFQYDTRMSCINCGGRDGIEISSTSSYRD